MTKSDEESYKERRRFQRIRMTDEQGRLAQLLGAKAKWMGAEEVSVYDMSYSGAAIGRPQKTTIGNCEKYDLYFELGTNPPVRITSEVMWFNDNVVGLNFDPLSADARMVITNFLDEKLISANLTKIEPQYFAKNLDCDIWLQGPLETNIYLWKKNEQMSRAQLEIAGVFVDFDGQSLKFSKPTGEYYTPDKSVLQRCIDILSQVEYEHESIHRLMEKIVKVEA